MQKKMTVWLITFQVGEVLNLFFFLQVATRMGELVIAETSENVAGDETDIERISPTTRRTEVRIVSTPPHSWVRNSNLSSRIYVSIFLRKKGRRHLILHGGSILFKKVNLLRKRLNHFLTQRGVVYFQSG